MHTCKFGVNQLLFITSATLNLFHVCASIYSTLRTLQHNQQASAHIRSRKHNLKGCSRLSVECRASSLVFISSSQSPLSATMCVHRFVQNLEIYRIISSPVPIPYTRGILGSQVSVESIPHCLVSNSSSPLSLSAILCSLCVHRSVKDLEILLITSRPVPIS